MKLFDLAQDPSNPVLHHRFADELAQLCLWDAARASYLRAEELSEQPDPERLYALACVEIEMTLVRSARCRLERVLQLLPGHARATETLRELLRRCGMSGSRVGAGGDEPCQRLRTTLLAAIRRKDFEVAEATGRLLLRRCRGDKEAIETLLLVPGVRYAAAWNLRGPQCEEVLRRGLAEDVARAVEELARIGSPEAIEWILETDGVALSLLRLDPKAQWKASLALVCHDDPRKGEALLQELKDLELPEAAHLVSALQLSERSGYDQLCFDVDGEGRASIWNNGVVLEGSASAERLLEALDGQRDFPEFGYGRVPVFCCPGCGMAECWAFLVRVAIQETQVCWSDFSPPCADWGPFYFEPVSYLDELKKLQCSTMKGMAQQGRTRRDSTWRSLL